MDLEKMRSVRQGGKTKGMVNLTTLTEGGKTRGFQVEYSDGRIEGVVRPEAVEYKLSLKEQS